jgi:hypothetical protein
MALRPLSRIHVGPIVELDLSAVRQHERVAGVARDVDLFEHWCRMHSVRGAGIHKGFDRFESSARRIVHLDPDAGNVPIARDCTPARAPRASAEIRIHTNGDVDQSSLVTREAQMP